VHSDFRQYVSRDDKSKRNGLFLWGMVKISVKNERKVRLCYKGYEISILYGSLDIFIFPNLYSCFVCGSDIKARFL